MGWACGSGSTRSHPADGPGGLSADPLAPHAVLRPLAQGLQLASGYKGDTIKRYFLDYEETVTNDFVMREGGKKIELLGSDIHDWNITFVDTGMNANIGMRPKAVQPYVENEELFLANYSDWLSDLPLPDVIQFLHSRPEAVACFTGVAPTSSFHLVNVGEGGLVQSIRHVKETEMRVNGGFFVFRPQLFEWMNEGEELVQEPFQRLAKAGKLLSYNYDGFGLHGHLQGEAALEDLTPRPGAPAWKTAACSLPGRKSARRCSGCRLSGAGAHPSRSARTPTTSRSAGGDAAPASPGAPGSRRHPRSSAPPWSGRARRRPRAEQFLDGAAHRRIVKSHRDGFLPLDWAAVKEEFEQLKREVSPDLILTHYREDRHQDHRVVSEPTWNTWRNHLIWEFEIPKYDGDFGSLNLFVPSARRPWSERSISC